MAIERDLDESMFVLRVEDLDEGELKVLRLSGVEGLSRLYRFDLELVSENDAIDFDAVVGKSAALAITGQNAVRYLNGIVSFFEQGPIGKRFHRYYAQVVPRFWYLLQRSDCRIFQDQSVPDILAEVFKTAGIASDAYRSTLTATYPPREYCVQYDESDWAFVSRLMEEEGIFYFFEHDEEDHVLVLGDDSSAHPDVEGDADGEPNVVFRDPTGGTPEQEYVGSFRFSKSVRTGAVSIRDYDFTKPNTTLEGTQRAEHFTDFQSYEFPGRFAESDQGTRLSHVRNEEHQALRQVGSGYSVCRRFLPGLRFHLIEHYRDDFNRDYLITDLQHEGYEPQALEEEAPTNETEVEYTNQFRCIPADVPYRPVRVTPRPQIRGTQTAVVVGPSGEEIYTDEYGRIKVQFFWDRKGQLDENSSCWMRVNQAYAGTGWGTVFLPRIGQEVLVGFLEGDPDRPHVLGGVYNANNMPPYALPDFKTVTTIKSSSSTGGEGFNEIRLEDKAGEEQLFVHAQKQLDVRVLDNRYETVGTDRHLVVKQNQIEHVENERHTTVDQDDFSEFGKDQHIKIVGKQAVEIGDSQSLSVTGDVIEVFQSNHSEEVTQSYYVKAMGVVIEADMGVTIKCGPSSIVVDSAGVTLKGPLVTVDGDMVNIASAPGSPPSSGSAGSLVSPSAPMAAEEADEADPGAVAEARAEQAESGEGKYGATPAPAFHPSDEEDPDDEESSWIEIELVDEDGNPVPGARYEITLPDGEHVARGTLDNTGYARVNGIEPGTCLVCFPDLDEDAWEPI